MQITPFGKFRLLKKVATGGMAELFLGCTGSSKTGYKFLIIKKVMAAQSDNKEFKKMFQNEGKVAININHRNVISMFEFGLQKEQFFICMEYIAGRNLRQLTKKLSGLKQKLSVEQCAYIIKDIGLGLDYVHNCTDNATGRPLGIIHRDVSPQNIMVAFSGDVKLIDFGIAKLNNTDSTKSGVLKGKFEYMSPEQVRGQPLDRQTDIFSLGVVFWELLAGRKLFTGKDEMQILRRIRSGQIPDLKQIRENVPEPLIKIIHRMLHSNKAQRYKSMADIGSELSVFLNEYYPKFTPNHFSSFVREIYAEEILEERKTIKTFLNELKSSELVAPEGSSAGYENNDSSFVTSPSHPVKDEENPARDLDSTQTDISLYTDTSDSRESSYQSVTETVFDDEVETQRELVLKNPSPP